MPSRNCATTAFVFLRSWSVALPLTAESKLRVLRVSISRYQRHQPDPVVINQFHLAVHTFFLLAILLFGLVE